MSVSRDGKIKAIIKSYLTDPIDFLSLYNGLDMDMEDTIFNKCGIKIGEVSKSEWFDGLFDVIEDYINKGYLNNNDKHLLSNIFPIVSTIYSYGEYDDLDISLKLFKLSRLINKKLETLTDKNYYDYKEVQNRLAELAIANRYDLMDLYNGYNFDLIRYILFEQRDKKLSLNVLEEYPSIISIYLEGEYLFNRLIDEYLKVLRATVKDNFKDTTDYEYYSELINVFLNNQELHISSRNKKELLNKLNSYKELVSNNNSSKKARIFDDEIDELINRIELISDINIKNLIKKFDIDMDFDPIINQEYYSLRRPEDLVDNFEHEVIANTCIVSIDFSDTYIFDDALSVEFDKEGNYILGVHTADPTNYIIPGGLIDRKARERAFSFLFGKSMFPKGLLKNYLTLKEGVPRYATSYFFTIDKKGHIIKEEYKKTLLMVNKNLTVNQANDILKYGAKNEYIDNTLRNLDKCRQLLDNYYNFDPEYEIEKSSNPDISNTRIEGRDRASTIVRYAMALPNHRIAKLARENRFPYIYRNFYKDGDGLGEYSTTCRGHEGLGFDAYGHITSPLNKYIDFSNVVALNTWYFNTPTDDELQDLGMELNTIAHSINVKERKFKNLVKAYNTKTKVEG